MHSASNTFTFNQGLTNLTSDFSLGKHSQVKILFPKIQSTTTSKENVSNASINADQISLIKVNNLSSEKI